MCVIAHTNPIDMYLLTIVNQHTQEKQEISFFDKEKAINSFIDTAKDYCYPIYAKGNYLEAGGPDNDYFVKVEEIKVNQN